MDRYARIKCLHCQFEWKRTKKGKLSPSRNCPQCFKLLKLEDEDYSWISYGRHRFNVAEAAAFKELKHRSNKQSKKGESDSGSEANLPTNKLPDLFTILGTKPQLTKEQKRLIQS